MILTKKEIEIEVKNKRVIIEPFNVGQLEPNSYGFRLSSSLICYDEAIVDPLIKPREQWIDISESGYCLEPGKFYLGCTMETMGSDYYVSTLYSRRSVSSMGVWIQFSAPLGHTGAIIPWTLEITVANPVIVYAGMLIGKLAFWNIQGSQMIYSGKYIGSSGAVSSMLSCEMNSKG